MAPETTLEQNTSQNTSRNGKAVDWWASGCILFQMLTGKPVSCICRPIRRFLIDAMRFGQPFYSEVDCVLWRRIRSGVYKWPRVMSRNPKHLVSSLLTADPSTRLGAGGADEVKSHPWLARINWNKMERRLYMVCSILCPSFLAPYI
jgi:serine/threonine protein kinase